jgi:hypothetical protein
VQSGSQDKVAIEQGAGFAKKREEIFAHLRESAGETPAGPTGKMPVLQSSRRVIRRLLVLICDRNNLDFHIRVFG